ncbi:MAG: glycosyltransferase family 2 protein [Limisphaerales bacterium]
MGEETAIVISVVVPVYKEEKCVDAFLEQTIPILESVTGDFEIIFALDPSPDRTEAVILGWRDKDPRIKLLKFSRRFGQPMAVLAGLQYSSGEAVVVMDVDLQDPPELLKDMAAKWREGFDVVMAWRRNREGDTWLKRLTNLIGYKIIERIVDPPIPPETGDFRLMNRRVVNEINRLKECHGFLRGLVAVVGFKQISIPFDRPARLAGTTHYNRFWGSLRIGFNGIVCFSNSLLSLSAKAGFLIAATSFFMGIVYFIMKIFGFPFPIGNPTIVILILFMGGIQLVSVGILGEYIARIYEEVKQRPKFIIDQAIGFNRTTAPKSEPPSDRPGKS